MEMSNSLNSLGDPSGELHPPLCIAIRHIGTPRSHDEAVDHWGVIGHYYIILLFYSLIYNTSLLLSYLLILYSSALVNHLERHHSTTIVMVVVR